MQFQEASFTAAACVQIWKWIFFNLPKSDRVRFLHALQLQNHCNNTHARCWLFPRLRMLLMTPASPPEPKTRQGKQVRVMTLSGPITQNALSIFIPHHSHIILINHLPYKLFSSLFKLWTEDMWKRVVLNETQLITCSLTVRNALK